MRATSYNPTGLEAIDQNGPQLLFAEHHRSLRRAAEDLMARAHEDDCFSLVAEFRAFEKQILEHVQAEEDIVLPAYAVAFPEEAAEIRRGHAAIRKQLEQTALDCELHSIRIEAIRDLLAKLEDHAKYEDQTMYPWAQVHLPVASRNAIGTILRTSIRKLADFVNG